STPRSPSGSARPRPTSCRARRRPTRTTAPPSTPTTRPTSTRSPTGPLRSRSAATAAARSARTTRRGPRRGPRSRARPVSAQQGALRPLSRALWCRPRLKLALLLSAPVRWLVGAPPGPRAVLLVSAFWSTDSFTAAIVRRPTADNFTTLVRGEVYRAISLRTVGLAVAVTVVDVVLRFPVWFLQSKVARRRWR